MTLSPLLEQYGVVFIPGTTVIFNDFNGQEREPELVSSANEVLRLLGSWPSLGGTQFALQGQMLSLFLYGTKPSYVDAVTTSVSSTGYVLQPGFKTDYDKFLAALHSSFQAMRTIGNYELLSPDSFWREELSRVRSGSFLGSYPIDFRSV